MVWNPFHLVLAGAYVSALLFIGAWVGRKSQDSNQYLHATGMLPLWVCTVACIAANCGSLDVMAMMALSAQYGIVAAHFYWIGAIPALIALAFWMLPAYARGSHVSILDFIARYYGQQTRTLVAACVAFMMLLICGVCLCAVAQTLAVFLGWSFLEGVLLTAPVVMFYTWAGGFRATIYTELIHFSVVLAAILPLSVLVVRDFGGFRGLLASIPPDRLHAWANLGYFAPAAPMDRVGLIFGLGMVLSFGYWSTDYVLMQRALAVRRGSELRLVPFGLGFAKMLFALLIVLPGVAAPVVLGPKLQGAWNTTLPAMILHYYKPSWVVIGIMGLVASLVATFAGNVSGFSAAWMQGIYRPLLRPVAPDKHYVRMGRLTGVVAILLSIGGAYVALEYRSMMEYMQMIFSTFNAPIFALVVLTVLWPKRAASGGAAGFLCGLGCGVLHQLLAHAHVFRYGSQMTTNFYGAIFGFVAALGATLAFGGAELHAPVAQTPQTVPVRFGIRYPWRLVAVAAVMLSVCIVLNAFFW